MRAAPSAPPRSARRPTRTHLVATVSSLAAAVALVAGVLSATAPLTPTTPSAAPVACTDVAVVTVEQAADLTGTCDYAGVTIDIGDGRTIGVPAAGTTLALDALAAGGADDASDADAVVQRTAAGRVSVLLGHEAHEAHEAHAPHADAGALGTAATAAVPTSTSCAASARTAFVKTGRSWPGAYTWKSNDSGRPSSNSTSVIDAAFKSMASGGTRCGAGATVATRASAVLAGTTTARARDHHGGVVHRRPRQGQRRRLAAAPEGHPRPDLRRVLGVDDPRGRHRLLEPPSRGSPARRPPAARARATTCRRPPRTSSATPSGSATSPPRPARR